MNSLLKPTGSLGLRIVSLAATAALMLSVSHADPVILSDLGSTAVVNLDDQAGMSQWNVTGLPSGMENQLNQQWFWYRIGDTVPQPINAIGTAIPTIHSANSVSATYANSQVEVTIKYTLTGGGIGQADISEGITLRNLNPGSPLDFHFYQYSDFNLLGSASGDFVSLDQSYVVQWKGDTQIAEAIVAPEASRFEANTTGGTSSTLYNLNNTAGYNLNGNGYAEGDVTWAYQWDFMNLTTEAIQKDKLLSVTLIPEPSTAALLAIGLGVLGMIRRRH